MTELRTSQPLLVHALPVAGLAIGFIYQRHGSSIKAGNNLVIDTIHDEGPEIPLRMAPMVLIGTVLTHVFGGSAGREGTAVQMGASITDWVSHRLRVEKHVRRQLLAAGVAGGCPANPRGSRRELTMASPLRGWKVVGVRILLGAHAPS